MKLNFDKYRDKVYACMIGKNIGGTIGGPYEGRRQTLDIKGFSTEAGVPLPNDDLDLQLVWLVAMEKFGPHNLDANVLADYWTYGIVPNYNEYGIGKANARVGFMPPMSGDYNNPWKDSNGAWIRTEVWASLCPGNPYGAVRYAVEDGMVDHGTGEGTIAAAFVAAMQSAAFIVSDVNEVIKVGLAAIPEDSRTAKMVKLAYECYEKGMDVLEARNIILKSNEEHYGGWMEAPSNIGYVVLGLLYGEGDFKKSMLLAINCGDDTDCTGATVGATLGILGGTKAIPEDWKAHIGDDIVTICIAGGIISHMLPKTCNELTDRIVKISQSVLDAQYKNTVQLHSGDDEIDEKDIKNLTALFDHETNGPLVKRPLAMLTPNSIKFGNAFIEVTVIYDDKPEIAPLEEKKLKVLIRNKHNTDSMAGVSAPYIATLRWLGGDTLTAESRTGITIMHGTNRTSFTQTIDVTIRAGEKVNPINRIVLEIFNQDMAQTLYVPVTFLG